MTKPYRPSNGTEGAIFDAQWCSRCERDAFTRGPDGDPSEGCEILARSLIHNITDPDYPREWQWRGEGGNCGPVCTAFVAEGDEVLELLDPSAVIRPLL